ncbi:MAG: GNAT family N-acetyltransferase [Candidatus Eisenbacteria bacterium]
MSEFNVEIRRLARPDEAETCARLMSGSEPWKTLRRDYETSLKILTSPTREVYVALVGGEIVGFIILIMSGAFVGFVQTIAIMPEWRNKKIGSRLMGFAEERIFGVTANVFVCVSSFNPDARRLYERLGYSAVGELEDLIVPGHSEILLRKTTGPLTEFKENS